MKPQTGCGQHGPSYRNNITRRFAAKSRGSIGKHFEADKQNYHFHLCHSFTPTVNGGFATCVKKPSFLIYSKRFLEYRDFYKTMWKDEWNNNNNIAILIWYQFCHIIACIRFRISNYRNQCVSASKYSLLSKDTVKPYHKVLV